MRDAKSLAHAYFDAVTAGELPDNLLTANMTAWTTTQGPLDKATYQNAIRLLARMCKVPPAFTVDVLTAEGDRVVAEARSRAILIDDTPYENTYVFVFAVRDGRITFIAEHFNALIVQEKLIPLIPRVLGPNA